MQTPTMVQYFTSPKSSRGSRLGRGADSTSTMEQYGYSAPGTNITVSPTFSDIGNPTVEGLSVGDISLSNQRDSFSESGPGSLLSGRGPGGIRPGGIQTPPLPTPPRPTPPRPSSGGGGGGGRNGGGGGGGGRNGGGGGGGGRNGGGGGGETRGNTLARALQGAVKTGQPGTPRVTKSELKSTMQETSQGPRGLRNSIEEGNINLGGKALNFLNKQLEKKGAKPVGPVSKPAPGKLQDKPQIAPFNSGSNPYAPFQAMQTGANKAKDNKGDGKKDNKKAEAKGKAQAAKKKK